ncbi:MAG TPA: TetR family transcriptional regulator [Streptosporangiaceae bacterium]|nr:TetR family transcriptional regulator [Streptosporangiaceae bacterium]
MDDAGNTAATARDLPRPASPGRPPSTTRHQLQDIAVEMFSEQGYDEVTIEALAAAAGISRRTFFRYFSSKADALMAGFDADVERLRAVLADSDPGLPLMEAIRNAVVEVNDYHADDLARLRQRLLLQHSNPALLANGILHYEEWQAVVAEFAARRLGQQPRDLLPQVIARSVFGAAYAGFMSWLADETGDLSPRLDGALGAMAEAFQA